MKSKGLAIIVRNEMQFNRVKEFLGDLLYLSWFEEMTTVLTAVAIYYQDDELLSIGSVGSVEYKLELGFRLVEFDEFFK